MNVGTLISLAMHAAVLAGQPHYHTRHVVQPHGHVVHTQPARSAPAPEKTREFDPNVAWHSK
jgi:hypothetical protein